MKTILVIFLVQIVTVYGKIAFEKLTDYDFTGTTYYSVKNISLYECQGWCNQEQDCVACTFRFSMNPLMPDFDTMCQLHNSTQALDPTALPQRANSLYYMVKLNIRSENVCQRPWSFERVPNKVIRGLDNALIYTSTKEACLAACLNEVKEFTL
jgi:PAN domain